MKCECEKKLQIKRLIIVKNVEKRCNVKQLWKISLTKFQKFNTYTKLLVPFEFALFEDTPIASEGISKEEVGI